MNDQATKRKSEVGEYEWLIDPASFERDGDIAPERARKVVISNGPSFAVTVFINDSFVGGLDPRQEKSFKAAPGQPVEVRVATKGETRTNSGFFIFFDA